MITDPTAERRRRILPNCPFSPGFRYGRCPLPAAHRNLLADGDEPAIAPDSERVAFVRNRQIWLAPIDGSKQPQALFYARGNSESPSWSPDGKKLAFISNRTDHSFIGLFTPGEPIRFIAPSTSRDTQPVWSLDGRKIAFLRQPGTGGTPRSPCRSVETPWQVMVARHSIGQRAEHSGHECNHKRRVAGGSYRPESQRHRAAMGSRRLPGLHVLPRRVSASLLAAASGNEQPAGIADSGIVHGRTRDDHPGRTLDRIHRQHGAGRKRYRPASFVQSAGDRRNPTCR